MLILFLGTSCNEQEARFDPDNTFFTAWEFETKGAVSRCCKTSTLNDLMKLKVIKVFQHRKTLFDTLITRASVGNQIEIREVIRPGNEFHTYTMSLVAGKQFVSVSVNYAGELSKVDHSHSGKLFGDLIIDCCPFTLEDYDLFGEEVPLLFITRLDLSTGGDYKDIKVVLSSTDFG